MHKGDHWMVRMPASLLYGAEGDGRVPPGATVIYDDRDERPGVKFANAELMGIPYSVTVSDRNLAEGTYEMTVRNSGETTLLTREELLAKLS